MPERSSFLVKLSEVEHPGGGHRILTVVNSFVYVIEVL